MAKTLQPSNRERRRNSAHYGDFVTPLCVCVRAGGGGGGGGGDGNVSELRGVYGEQQRERDNPKACVLPDHVRLLLVARPHLQTGPHAPPPRCNCGHGRGAVRDYTRVESPHFPTPRAHLRSACGVPTRPPTMQSAPRLGIGIPSYASTFVALIPMRPSAASVCASTPSIVWVRLEG